MNPVAGRRKLVDEPLRLGAIAPANTNGIAALGKTSRHRGADRVAASIASFCASISSVPISSYLERYD